MKGHVYKRGKTYTYVIDGPADPLTGKRKQVTKGGHVTEREAWRECRAAMKRVEEGRHVAASRRSSSTNGCRPSRTPRRPRRGATGRSTRSPTSCPRWAIRGCRI
jgi:hypothetical protein